MSLKWSKDDGSEVAELVTTSGKPVGTLEVVLGWDQPTGGGFLGKFRNKTDIDVSAILFAGDEDVDYVSPKEHPSALGGRVFHHGDAKEGHGESGGERITFRLKDIRVEDADITAIALTASCATGAFSKIAGAVCRFYDATGAEREHLDNVRFSVSGGHTGALLGVLKKNGDHWTFAKAKSYGPGGGWRQLADLARSHVR